MSVSLCWEVGFDVSKEKPLLQELEQKTAAPDFWNNANEAQRVVKQRAALAARVESVEKIQKSFADLEAFLDLVQESKDEELMEEMAATLKLFAADLEAFELREMLSGEHDNANAILEVNPGAGGTEAQDWGDMLLRMYLRWAEKHGFKAEIVNYQPGEGAGLKNATVFMEGAYAFGFLRAERGVHRLVRISPFDSNARRHTSFASISVVPDIEQEVNIDVRDEDLRVDTYRSSGAGGQHVNKTDSAVRLTHLPTGIVVACQNERSQHKNKARAMKLLKAKLYELEMEKKRAEIEKLAGERRKIDFGSQIRSYVMHPYQMVKDLRTDCETSDVQSVMDGDLDAFIKAYLLSEEHNIT